MNDAIEQMVKDILDIETVMLASYGKLLKSVDNNALKSIISGIIEDEERHVANAKKALEIVRG
jgi:rubrerythrin